MGGREKERLFIKRQLSCLFTVYINMGKHDISLLVLISD